MNGISLWYPGDTAWTDYYFAKNLQGDVLEVYDSSHTCVASYTYDSWGNILSKSGDLADINPFRYRSYYYDTETWFYYLQSRYYDPQICRFINADDTAYLGADGSHVSYNLFAYCSNNPVMRVDPTGCWSWTDVFNTAAAITVAAVVVAVIVCSGGSAAPPMLAAASALAGTTVTASTAASAALGVAVTGTAIMGTAAAANIHELANNSQNKKPTSQNQMQKQVESGKAPKEVDRVDKPHVNAPNQQNHIHFKDGSSINVDGSISHDSRGIPQITRTILEWIISNGWNEPTF